MSNRIADAFDELIGQMEEPPPWEQLSTFEKPQLRRDRRVWILLAAGFVGLLVFVVGLGFFPPQVLQGDAEFGGPVPPSPTIPPGTTHMWSADGIGEISVEWRATGIGSEMCWRTESSEGCSEAELRTPLVVVAHVSTERAMVFTQTHRGDRRPGYVILHLDDGSTLDVEVESVYSHRDLTLYWGASPELGHRTPIFGVVVEASPGDSSCAAQAHRLVAAHLRPTDGGLMQVSEIVELCGVQIDVVGLSDWLFIAEDRGVDLMDLISTRGWQTQFGAAVDQLREEFPDIYAGAEFQQEGAWVAFKGSAPNRAHEILSGLPVTVIENRGFSEHELNDVLTRAASELSSTPGVTALSGSYDQVTGEITIQVATADPSALGDLRRWDPPNPTIKVTVQVVSRIPGGG